jgi:hypothetical protein
MQRHLRTCPVQWVGGNSQSLQMAKHSRDQDGMLVCLRVAWQAGGFICYPNGLSTHYRGFSRCHMLNPSEQDPQFNLSSPYREPRETM